MQGGATIGPHFNAYDRNDRVIPYLFSLKRRIDEQDSRGICESHPALIGEPQDCVHGVISGAKLKHFSFKKRPT